MDPVAKRISLSIREAMEDSALNYSAEIPGEGAEAEAGAQDNTQNVPDPTPYVSAPQEDAGRPETSFETAMRKANEEKEANEGGNAGN